MRRTPLLLLCLTGVVLFTGLGIWQLERRIWKLELIQRVTSRVHAPPVAAPGPAAWPTLTRQTAEYRHVTVQGQFDSGHSVVVLAVTDFGRGHWLLTPLRTSQGWTVLINRGFLPAENTQNYAQFPVSSTVAITGLLRLSEPHGAFLHTNQPTQNRWYSRDVMAISTAQHLSNTAPYFIDADATPNPNGVPIGGLTVIAFPNNHLIYAITWFSLAALCGYATWRTLKSEA